MDFNSKLPEYSKILVLGGGIHGVGVLHDLLSRGWKDVHLLEKKKLASGTSSCSTKLIHGGLRYLASPSQIPMVSECLQERKLLLNLVPNLVKPLEILIPIYRQTPEKAWKIKIGLKLYDVLAGKQNIKKHNTLKRSEYEKVLPLIKNDNLLKVFSYWDAQTNDKKLVEHIGRSCTKLNGKISERSEVVSLGKSLNYWLVKVRSKDGTVQTIKTNYIINCLGPWAHSLYEDGLNIKKIKSLNNKGTHLVLKDLGLKQAFLLYSPIDQRIFFLTPWEGKTLLGTTESIYDGDPTNVEVKQEEVDYLLKSVNTYLSKQLSEQAIIDSFSGLRWLALAQNKGISKTPREATIDEQTFEHGKLLTLYGGKLTSYRSLAEKTNNLVLKSFKFKVKSRTKEQDFWV